MVRTVLEMMAAGLARQGSRRICWLPVAMALGIAGYFSLEREPSALFCLLVGAMGAVGLCLLLWSASFEAVRERVAMGQLFARYGGGLCFCMALGFLLAWGQASRQPPMPLLPMESVWLEGRVTMLEPVAARHEGQAMRWHLGIGEAVLHSPWWAGMAPLRRSLVMTYQPKGKAFPAGRGGGPSDVSSDVLSGGLSDDLPDGLAVGRRVRLRALLRSPGPPLWPGGYDGQRAAWFAGRAGGGSVLSPPQLIPDDAADGGVGGSWFGGVGRQVLNWLEQMRQHVAGRIIHLLPGQRGAVAAAVLCGQTGLVSPQIRQDYAASGLAHLLAVAGLHLGFVMGLAFGLARRVMSLSQRLSAHWPCRELALLFSLAVGAGYVLLTGAHLPGLRALGMASLAVLAFLLRRRVLSLRSLALVALALELASPVLVLDISFQMSFAAVMALIAGYEPLRGVLARLGGHGGRWDDMAGARRGRPALWRGGAVLLVTLVMTSLLAGLATLPLSMAYFGAFQPWFVLANLLAVPLMGLWVMPAGLLALLLMPFGLSALPLHVMGWGIGVIGGLAAHVAAAPLASWPVSSFPSWVVGVYLLGLAVLCLWRGHARFVGIVVMGCALGAIWLIPRPVMILAGQDKVMVFRQVGGMELAAGRLGNKLARDELQRALGWSGGDVGKPECEAGICRLPLGRGMGDEKGDSRAVILWPETGYRHREHAVEEHRAALCRDVVLEVHVGYQRLICPSVRQLGPEDVRRDGSWAVYEAGPDKEGVALVSGRMRQGRRLWVGEEGFRGVPPLPLAEAE